MIRTAYIFTIWLGASLGVLACTDPLPDAPPANTPPPGSTTGGEGTTFDHQNDTISVWDLLNRLTEQGPPSFTSQMHGCSKLHYSTLGNVLRSFGVNLASTAVDSAGQLYQSSRPVLGGPNYATRIRESAVITTSQASREFDIFASAASEIIAALPSLLRCRVGSVSPVLFDASNMCHAEGISCLIGSPATQANVDLCNQTILRASTPDVGKRLAVAVMLAAAYTCE
jgi:hypothetical protein